MKSAILKGPQTDATMRVPTETDAGSNGEEGEEATETEVQTEQHLVEQTASWVCVVVEQEQSCHTCQAVESKGGQQHC